SHADDLMLIDLAYWPFFDAAIGCALVALHALGARVCVHAEIQLRDACPNVARPSLAAIVAMKTFLQALVAAAVRIDLRHCKVVFLHQRKGALHRDHSFGLGGIVVGEPQQLCNALGHLFALGGILVHGSHTVRMTSSTTRCLL